MKNVPADSAMVFTPFFRLWYIGDREAHCVSFYGLDVAVRFHGQGGRSGSGSGQAMSLVLHFGQWATSRPVRRRMRSAGVSLGSSLGGSGGGCMPSEVRMVLRACFLLVLDRKP